MPRTIVKFEKEEINDLCRLIEADGLRGLANELYWWNCMDYYTKASHPEIASVMRCPIRKVPFKINSKEVGVATIAKWRLRIGK